MPTLNVDHVSKRLAGAPVLVDVTFTADTGQLVGFIGPNGAGKTTTFRIILGLLIPDSGSVQVAGRPVCPDDRAQIAFCFDDDGVYDGLTARENIDFFKIAYGSQVDSGSLLERVGLDPDDRKVVGRFSRGMRKRLGIARTLLVPEPSLVLLDEPFLGLDPEGQQFLTMQLRDLSNRAAVLISSHDLRAVEAVCDTIVVLDKRVMYAGSPHGFGSDPTGRTDGTLTDRYLAARKKERGEDDPQ